METKILLQQRALQGYYLATPLFVSLDAFFHVNIRAYFLESLPALKFSYYGLCFVFGIWMWRYPRSTNWIGLGECTVNIFLLLAGFMTAYCSLFLTLPAMIDQGRYPAAFTFEGVANLALSLAFFTVAFYSNPIIKNGIRIR